MIIDLPSLESPVLELDVAISPESIDLTSEDVKLESAVRIEGKLTRGIAQVSVSGKISTNALVECTRCLQPIKQKLNIPFNTEFVTAEYYTAKKEAELDEKDLDISVFDGHQIDLSELVREQILLSIPEQVFCREDCQGLCEKCSANRNLVNCNCNEKEVDPRWAALKNLK